MQVRKALAIIALIAALPAARAEQLRMDVTATGTLIYNTQGEDFPFGAAGDPVTMHWSALYDTDDILAGGRAVPAISGRLAVSVGGQTLALTNLWQYSGIGIGKATNVPPTSFFQSPAYTNEEMSRSYSVQLFLPAALLNAIPTAPGTVSYAGPRIDLPGLRVWNSAGDADDFIPLEPVGMTVTVSAVPEPATCAMLLVGLAAVGTVARRRQR